jgi:hypothetical protein
LIFPVVKVSWVGKGIGCDKPIGENFLLGQLSEFDESLSKKFDRPSSGEN